MRPRVAFLVLVFPIAVLAAGCSYGKILGVEAPDPAGSPILLVHLESRGLARKAQECRVVAQWAGYQAMAPIPLTGRLNPERLTVELSDWIYNPNSRLPVTRMEVRFLYKNKAISRERFAPVFRSPAVFEGRRARAPRTRKRSRRRTTRRQRSKRAEVPASWRTSPRDWSRDLKTPGDHRFPHPIVCGLDVKSGPRYVRVRKLPNKMIKLLIDVKSRGDPRQMHEVTWWRIELLDEEGLPIGTHVEDGFVDVGGEQRHIGEWDFDGSTVIFKLSSGSAAGDWMRLRFSEAQ